MLSPLERALRIGKPAQTDWALFGANPREPLAI